MPFYVIMDKDCCLLEVREFSNQQAAEEHITTAYPARMYFQEVEEKDLKEIQKRIDFKKNLHSIMDELNWE